MVRTPFPLQGAQVHKLKTEVREKGKVQGASPTGGFLGACVIHWKWAFSW